MDFVFTVRLSRDELVSALQKDGLTITGQQLPKIEAVAPTVKPAKKAKAAPVVESEEFDETEEEEAPAKPAKAKPAKKAKAAPVPEEEEEESEEEEEAEEEEEESEEEESEEEFISGEQLTKLKKALNAHKAAQGGKPKKTLEILRKFAPGGSEKVKPDVFPQLLKALKV